MADPCRFEERPDLRRRTLLGAGLALAAGVSAPGAGWPENRPEGAAGAGATDRRVPIHGGNPPEYPSSGQQHAKMHLDQLKGAWGWLGAAGKDETGYPLALDGTGPAVSRILSLDPGMAGIAPYAGSFRLYGKGRGEIAIRIHPEAGLPGGRRPAPGARVLVAQVDTATLPRAENAGVSCWYLDLVYDPATTPGPVQLEIHALPDPADRLRGMALIHASHRASWHAGARFMPEVVADLSVLGHQQATRGGGRGALRLMQSMQANLIWRDDGTDYLTQTDAQKERRYVGPDYYSFPKRQNDGPSRTQTFVATALPVEDAVRLANETGMDLWYNLPADVVDGRAEAIGLYVRDHLDPALRVYWEYGNENWNGAHGFNSHAYVAAQGRRIFPDLADAPAAAAIEFEVYRGMQLFARLRDIFAGTPARSRYVAAFWAYDASNTPDGQVRETSHAARYFAARLARQRPDIGALPETTITDMAVGGYFGAVPQAVLDDIARSFPDAAARAAALKRLLLQGLDGAFVALDPSALARPAEAVDPVMAVGVYALIRRDIEEAGLDPVTDLGHVLRLRGAVLEYRGVLSPDWRPVLRYTGPPGGDVETLRRAARLSGFGRMFRENEPQDGSNGQLRNALAFRVTAHAAFARARGLTLLFYEAGMGGDGAPASLPDGTGSFLQAFHLGPAGAEVMAAFVSRAAPDVSQILWYKTHDRFWRDGFRGLKEYYGQPAAAAPKWALVRDLARAR